MQRARALGAAIRLACDLSGRSPELLGRAALEIAGRHRWCCKAEEAAGPILLGEQTAKRAGTLAALLERDLKLRALPEARSRREPA